MTIIFWDYVIDWLGFKSALLERVLTPQPLLLIKNGRFLRRSMETEMLTEDELLDQLRLQGVEDISQVKECRLESSGEFSVLKRSGSIKSNKKRKPGVN